MIETAPACSDRCGSAGAFGAAAGMGPLPQSGGGEIFPLPFVSGEFCSAQVKPRSRRVQQRLERNRAVERHADDAIAALNDLNGAVRASPPTARSAARDAAVDRVIEAVRSDAPPERITPEAAWQSVQRGAGPRSYQEDPSVECPYSLGHLALPKTAGSCCLLGALGGSDFESLSEVEQRLFLSEDDFWAKGQG